MTSMSSKVNEAIRGVLSVLAGGLLMANAGSALALGGHGLRDAEPRDHGMATSPVAGDSDFYHLEGTDIVLEIWGDGPCLAGYDGIEELEGIDDPWPDPIPFLGADEHPEPVLWLAIVGTGPITEADIDPHGPLELALSILAVIDPASGPFDSPFAIDDSQPEPVTGIHPDLIDFLASVDPIPDPPFDSVDMLETTLIGAVYEIP